MKKINFLVITIALMQLGCSTVVLHPISKLDIFAVNKGAIITNPTGNEMTVEKQGWFISDFYMQKVIQAKTE